MTVQDSLQAIEHAIWHGDHTALTTLPQIHPTSWAGSVQLDARSFGLEPLLGFPKTPAEADLEVGAVLMVKDEADIIGANLSWLYFIGIRRMVVLDNGSHDATRDEIVAFRHRHFDVQLVIVDDPGLSYRQSLKTTGLLRLATSLWPELRWVFPLDADEFLVPARGLGILRELPPSIEVVTLPKVVHYLDADDTDDVRTSAFERMPIRCMPFLLPPKIGCRALPYLGVTDGNHNVTDAQGRSPTHHGGLSLGLYLREMQTRSFAQFKTKVVNGAPAVRLAREEGRFQGGDHWLALGDLLDREGDAGLRGYFRHQCVRAAGGHHLRDPFPGPS